MSEAEQEKVKPTQVQTFVDPAQLKRDVEFNINDMDNAMVSHASMFVHYSVQAASARRQYERMKAAFEITESRLYTIHRDSLEKAAADAVVTEVLDNLKGEEGADAKPKKGRKVAPASRVTEKQVEAAMKSDSRWWTAHERLMACRAQYDLAIDAKNAFEQRKDMLIQLASDRRKEREGELRVKALQDQRDAVLAGLKPQ